jgi:hypothetical protein
VDYRRRSPGTGESAGTVEESASPPHHERRVRTAQGLNSRGTNTARFWRQSRPSGSDTTLRKRAGLPNAPCIRKRRRRCPPSAVPATEDGRSSLRCASTRQAAGAVQNVSRISWITSKRLTILDCGGNPAQAGATPLSNTAGPSNMPYSTESAVAASLCRRSPKRCRANISYSRFMVPTIIGKALPERSLWRRSAETPLQPSHGPNSTR